MENQNCPCKKESCSRHGNCELCRAKHAESGKLTACERAEKRGERARRRAAEKAAKKSG